MWRTILIVGTGGFIGTVSRYLVQMAMAKGGGSTFPFSTFLVNMAGCFLIGVFYAFSEKGNLMSPEWRLFLTVGFCGGFTTFSTFALDNLNLLKDNSLFYLLFNAGGSLLLGILAVYLGIILIRLIF
jgi:fluoride exporter